MPLPPSLMHHVPHLVGTAEEAALRDYFASHGARTVEVDLTGSDSTTDVFDALKGALPFPDWCAAGWDCVDDAFEDLVAAWPFPLVLFARGVDALVTSRPQLGLATILGLERLSQSFSHAGEQLEVLYPWTVSSEAGARPAGPLS